jgi:NADPH:quinone reductase-like Zn-dependent oxidoreductase
MRLEDVEPPAPGNGQALVRVRAAAANPMDWKLSNGDSKFAAETWRSGWFAGAEAAEHAGVLEADGAGGGLDGGAVADQVLSSLQPQ